MLRIFKDAFVTIALITILPAQSATAQVIVTGDINAAIIGADGTDGDWGDDGDDGQEAAHIDPTLSSLTVNDEVSGGDGGDSRNLYGDVGKAGHGGDALKRSGSSLETLIITISNGATVEGGEGGNGGDDASCEPFDSDCTPSGGRDAGNGGDAIEGANLEIHNYGHIEAGRPGVRGAPHGIFGEDGYVANFTGGENILYIYDGGTIDGPVNGGKGHDSVIFDKSLNESTSAYDLGVSKGLEVVEKRGAGTLTLTGHGDTDWTITEGGLAGHAMAMSGDLNLVNAGTFVAFTNTSDRTHEGKITGVGHLTQKGSGITTLAGDNEYSGGTLVEDGFLAVDNENRLGTGITTLNGGGLQVTTSGSEVFQRIVLGTAGTFSVTDELGSVDLQSKLSGTGSLTKAGAGTLILSSTNTHSGGTTIQAGAISVDAIDKLGTGTTTLDGGTLSLTKLTGTETASNLALGTGGGTLNVVNADTSLDVTSGLSGVGSFTKSGSGTLILSGTNTHTGGTSVQAGRLKGDTDSIQGNVNIAAAAELELDQSNNGVFAGDISGAGQLIKSGISTISLTGTNTYAGGTTINAGLLSISDMAQLGTGEILLNGGTFRTTGDSDLTTDKFDLEAAGGELDVSSRSFTLTGDVSTTSDLRKTGTGALILDAASNTISGGTSVKSGSLIIGSTSGMSAVKLISDVAVESSAVLGGHGKIIGNVTNNGGRIAPGNSTGKMEITGDYSGTGTLEIEVEGDTKFFDQLVVNGKVDVSGTDLDLVLTPADKADWDVDPTGPFIIVDNNGEDEITGEFASVSDNLLFIDTALDYAAGEELKDIELTLTRNDIDFASSARTVNQKATGSAVQNLGSGNAVYNALIATVSDEAMAQTAFDSLSGEINASARGVLIENSRFVRSAVNERLYASSSKTQKPSGAQTSQRGSLTLWNTTFGSWGKADSNGNAASLEHSTGGVLFGADGDVFENVRMGLTGGYSRTKVEAHDNNSSATSDNYTLGGYAGTQFNAFSVRAGTALTWHQIETERSVTVSGGAFTDELEADQNAAGLQAFAELGYGFDFGPTSLEPFAGLAHVHLMSQGFTEDGGAAALSAKEQSADVTFTTLGVRATSQFTLGGMELTAQGLAGWQHASDDVIDVTQSFAGSEGTFTVAGTPIAKDIGILEAGLDLAIHERAKLGLSYSGQLAKESTKHGLTARLNLQF